MLTTDELTMADELLATVRELHANIEQATEYAKQRKLTEVATDWPRRVEALSKSSALVSEVVTQIERAFS